KEGFPSQGDPDYLRSRGAPGLWMVSKATGHGTSPEVRQRLDAFLKEYGDRGQVSPDHIRFLTYTTRYNRDYWVTLDQLAKHYERAEIDAERDEGRKRYRITTRNVTRLTLRETGTLSELRIDGRAVAVKPAPEIVLEKSAGVWRLARPAKSAVLH